MVFIRNDENAVYIMKIKASIRRSGIVSEKEFDKREKRVDGLIMFFALRARMFAYDFSTTHIRWEEYFDTYEARKETRELVEADYIFWESLNQLQGLVLQGNYRMVFQRIQEISRTYKIIYNDFQNRYEMSTNVKAVFSNKKRKWENQQ